MLTAARIFRFSHNNGRLITGNVNSNIHLINQKKWRFGKVKVYDFDSGEFTIDDYYVYHISFDNHID